MSVTKKTYAEFTVPGLFFPETDVVEVKSRDTQNLEIPEHAYCLRFFDILTTSIPNNGKKKVNAESNPVNYSCHYNIGTKIYSKKEMAGETAREKDLSKDAREGRERMMKQMTDDKLKRALRCQVGGFIKLKKGELVLLVNGKKREVVKVS